MVEHAHADPHTAGLIAMAERCALIVANDVYEHEGLSRLSAPGHDAEILRSVLSDPQIGRFQVTVIRNQPSHVIQRQIADFCADRQPDDLLLLHFSCHGLKNATGALYFAGSDTVPSRLTGTAVPAQFVNQEMTECRARRIALFLDCCYGGAFSRGMRARAADTVDVRETFTLPAGGSAQGRGRVVITASSATEYAFEDNRLTTADQHSPSVFTSALARGLSTGAADTGGDGLVDIDELYDYIYARVRATTTHQTPQKWADLQGKLVIGWVPPLARLAAAELPEELMAKVDEQLPTDRLAGVRDLRRLLLDEDREQAAGAMNVLRRLADDDSKEVSAAAAAALEEAQLKAVPDRVEIAEVRAAEPPAPYTVRLVGSPLARVFQVTESSRWISTEQSGAEDAAGAWVSITVDPAALPEYSGDLHGSVRILNRLGEIEIPVTARPHARLWPRGATVSVPRPNWLLDTRAIAVLCAVVLAAWPLTRLSTLHQSSFVGVGFFLLRAALLGLGVVLLSGTEHRRPVGTGLFAASVVYFLSDSLELLFGGPDVFSWLEFLATALLAAGLVWRHWPVTALPRHLKLVAPAQRPLAYLCMGAAAGQLLMLFVAVPGGNGTLVDLSGLPGSLIAVVPMSALCVATVLSEVREAAQRLMITAAVAAYYGPEVYFLVASLLLGRHYTYLGADTAGFGLSAAGFVLAQAVVDAALALSTLVLLRRALPRAAQASPAADSG